MSSAHRSLVMSSQDLSSFFSFQAFEKLLQTAPFGRATENSSNLPESAVDITAAVDRMSISGNGPSLHRMFSFLIDCSKTDFLLEGILAVSAACIHGPFWCPSPVVGLGPDSFVKDIITTVAEGCVDALKAAGAVSEKTAMSIVTLGRKISADVGVKLPKDQKLRDVLQGVPGIVLCGESRSSICVYLAACEASSADVLPPEAESGANFVGAIEHLRESNDLAAVVCALLCLWCKSPKSQSEFLKICREMSMHPKACARAVQHANSFFRALLMLDKNWLQEKIVLKNSGSQSANLTDDGSNAFEFLPIADHQSLRMRAATCASKDCHVANIIGDIAASNFSEQKFEIFSGFGEMKCRILFPDGSSIPCAVPLNLSLLNGQSCLGNYMRSTASAAEGCVGILCANRNPLLVNPLSPLRLEIICASSLAIDKLQASSTLPRHPACIISRTSRMEISVYGPDASVAEVCISMRDALLNVRQQLVAVPLVLGDEIGLIEANHRAIFGAGFRTTSIMSPNESNVVDILNVGHYLSAESGKPHFQKSGSCTLSDLIAAFEEMCLNKIFHPPHTENHPFAVDAKEWNGLPIISVSFTSAGAAAAACLLFSELPHSSLLQITSSTSSIAKPEPESAFRVTFSISQIKESKDVNADYTKSLVKEVTIAGRKYYAVNMKCCNKSSWHVGMSVPDPGQLPVQHRLCDFPNDYARGPGGRWHGQRIHSRPNIPQYERAVREEQRHDIARAVTKSAFTTHHASRRTLVEKKVFSDFASFSSDCSPVRISIPNQVFAHDGHKCRHSAECLCPIVDGPHRLTFDVIPRWSCCDAPCVDGESDLFCNAKPVAPFFLTEDLYHYCWETHYFISPADAHEAAVTVGALQYRKIVEAFSIKMKKYNEKKAASSSPADDSLILAREGPKNRYCLRFFNEQLANEAIEIISHPRQLRFSLGSTTGSSQKCLYKLIDLKRVTCSDEQCLAHCVTFNLDCEVEADQSGRKKRTSNVPLPNRHLLLGTLNHWGCSGILALDAVQEQITTKNADKNLVEIIQTALNAIQDTLTEQGISQAEFEIVCDPTFVLPCLGNGSAHSILGLYGCQMLSFVVSMKSQELRSVALSAVQTRLQGCQVESRRCEDMSYDLACCDIHPDTSKCVVLPLDAPPSFVSMLESELCKIRWDLYSHAPNSILNWISGPQISLTNGPTDSRRRRLVLESSDEGLVDQVLRLLGCYVNGLRLVPDSSLVWWFHSEQGFDFLTSLRASCIHCGVAMVIDCCSAVSFYGDYDFSKQMHSTLHKKLAELHNETQYSTVVINVSLPQLNRFIKRHGTLKDALQSFSPHVQNIRCAQADDKWKLVVIATPEGVKSVTDDVLVSNAQVEPSSRSCRYVCPVCFEGSDTLDDEWLVSLACGCIFHVPCAQLCYGCDEEDPLDPLKPRRLAPLDCFALNSDGIKCGKQLAQLDARKLIQDPEQLQRRVTEALIQFASIPGSGWRMCPVPTESVNCKVLYRTVRNTKYWSTRKCEGCGFEHCASCEGTPHPHGMSCREAIGDNMVSKDLLDGLDPSRFGRCPKCTLMIERAEACSHIICSRCNTHFHLQNH